MVFEQQKQLDQLNTFKVSAKAQYFYQFCSVDQLMGQLDKVRSFENRLVLGGGSNILFVGDFQGLVLYPQLFGIHVLEETSEHVWISVGASENWHEFVVAMTEQGFYGLENLALIPGTVGASPVQNIGAYGVEVKDVLHRVECVDLMAGQLLTFNNEDCEFDYRDSKFKKAGQGQYLVTRVEFKLSKTPQVKTSYQPLSSVFGDSALVSPLKVLKKVCEIRQAKLPDPHELPNAGSFFKNPVVNKQKFEQLKQSFPKLIAYAVDDEFKLAAGWLIDNAGLKGMQKGKVGVHKHQALVLVNLGELDGRLIWQLAKEVQNKVASMYGVDLEPEVRIEGKRDEPMIQGE